MMTPETCLMRCVVAVEQICTGGGFYAAGTGLEWVVEWGENGGCRRVVGAGMVAGDVVALGGKVVFYYLAVQCNALVMSELRCLLVCLLLFALELRADPVRRLVGVQEGGRGSAGLAGWFLKIHLAGKNLYALPAGRECCLNRAPVMGACGQKKKKGGRAAGPLRWTELLIFRLSGRAAGGLGY